MDEINHKPEGSEEVDLISDELLRIAASLMRELHPGMSGRVQLRLDSRLDRDLRLDSLGRVELLSRIEHSFDVALPESLLASAETLRDLLRALAHMQGKLRTATVEGERHLAPEEAELAPESVNTLTGVLDWHCGSHPERTHIIFYDDIGDGVKISYAELRDGASKIACGLLWRGLEPLQSVAVSPDVKMNGTTGTMPPTANNAKEVPAATQADPPSSPGSAPSSSRTRVSRPCLGSDSNCLARRCACS